MDGAWRKNKKLKNAVIVIILNKREKFGEDVEN